MGLELSRYQTGLTGELLVAAELARLGWAVALPSGNLPNIDLLAIREGQQVALQVKASIGDVIQFGMRKFFEVNFDRESKIQTIGALKNPELNDSIMVLVFVGETRAADYFFCSTRGKFTDWIKGRYQEYLDKNDGKRPGEGGTDHSTIMRSDLEDVFFLNLTKHFS